MISAERVIDVPSKSKKILKKIKKIYSRGDKMFRTLQNRNTICMPKDSPYFLLFENAKNSVVAAPKNSLGQFEYSKFNKF